MSGKIVNDLNPIFHPRSLAVIGASNDKKKFGYMFMTALIEMKFDGKLYPVNPREREILGFKAYPSIRKAPGTVDLAIVLVPPRIVVEVVKECAEKGVKGIIVFTAGFGETGAEGKRREREIVRIAREGGTRVIGPNCQGIYCPSSKLTFFPGMPKGSGSVGFISHSGSLAVYMTKMAYNMGIKFSKVISCGNECDLDATDFLEYLGKDPETEIIIAYLEGVKNGRRFLRIAHEVSRNKPIIVWKGGTTDVGARAAASHTGALAGASHIWEAVFKQTGVIGVKSIEEALDCLLAFLYLPLPKGRRVAIISELGGPAVAAADACAEIGLNLAEFSSETQEKLSEVIPLRGTSIKNPVDLGITNVLIPELCMEAIKIVGSARDADMLMVMSGPRKTAINMVVEGKKAVSKPIVTVSIPPPETSSDEYKTFLKWGIPVYPCPRRAARALAALARRDEFLRKHQEDTLTQFS